MGWIVEHARLIVAVSVAAILIGGSSYLAVRSATPAFVEASTETELLKAIAAKDTDSDGLPDWEEALYGTDPATADSKHLGMTDGEAVAKGLIVPKAIADIQVGASTSDGTRVDGLPPAPKEGTLTAAFAQSFFTLYMQAKERAGGGDLSQDELNQVVNDALQNLAATVKPAPDFKSSADLSVAGTGPAALTAFAANAEAVLLANTSSATTTPLANLRQAVMEGDTRALTRLTSLATMYRTSASGLAQLAVPQELAGAHLAVVNVLMRMSQLASDFSRVEDDPLVAILALGQYTTVGQALDSAFIQVANVYAAAGVSLSPGTPGAAFVGIASSTAPGKQR